VISPGASWAKPKVLILQTNIKKIEKIMTESLSHYCTPTLSFTGIYGSRFLKIWKKEAAKTINPGGLVGRFGLLPPDLNLQK
jgi:hypothetical protein